MPFQSLVQQILNTPKPKKPSGPKVKTFSDKHWRIIKMREAGIPSKEVAAKLGISKSLVSHVMTAYRKQTNNYK